MWSLFFLFMGLSALVGGIFHGVETIGEGFRFLSWSLLSISLLFALFAAYSDKAHKQLKIFFIFKSALLLGFSIYLVNFNLMVIDTALSLLGFVFLGNLFYLKNMSKWISFGILVSLVSVFFIVNKIIIDPQYLTYNDIGHYITILSLMSMSKGVYEDGQKRQSVDIEAMA